MGGKDKDKGNSDRGAMETEANNAAHDAHQASQNLSHERVAALDKLV